MIVARSHTAPTGDSARKNCAAKQNNQTVLAPMNVSTDKIASAGWHLAGHQSPQWHQRGKRADNNGSGSGQGPVCHLWGL